MYHFEKPGKKTQYTTQIKPGTPKKMSEENRKNILVPEDWQKKMEERELKERQKNSTYEESTAVLRNRPYERRCACNQS